MIREIEYYRNSDGRLRPGGTAYNQWQNAKRQAGVVHNASNAHHETAPAVNEEPLPFPSLFGEPATNNATNNAREDCLPLPVMDFSDRLPGNEGTVAEMVRNVPESNDVLPLPSGDDWLTENE